MEKKNSLLKKVAKILSILAKISILALAVHIIIACALGVMYTYDIFLREISTRYPFYILVIDFRSGLKSDILPLFFLIDNEFKIFLFLSLVIIFLATIRFLLVEENPLELLKAKNTLIGSYSFSHIFMTIFALETVYSIIIIVLGITPHIPVLPHPVIVMIVAPVEEEIAARFVWIGIPLIIVDLAKDLASFSIVGLARSIKNIPKKIVMGWGETNKISIVLTLISAAVFAQVHVKYGWDIWKFPSAFIAGIGLGIVFVKYGLLSSILLHFAWNSITYIPLANTVLGLLYFIAGLIFLVARIFKKELAKNLVEKEGKDTNYTQY